MNYTVIWLPTAEDELADVWLAAADQLAVTQAAHRLELALSRHPLAIGVPGNSSVNRNRLPARYRLRGYRRR
jgi:hypothetical protein